MSNPTFTVKNAGYSVSITDFSASYAVWVQRKKKAIMETARKWFAMWAEETKIISRSYTPESGMSGDTSLANSIKVNPIRPYKNGWSLITEVGISGWHSNFDEWYMEMFDAKPSWGFSSGELAIYIHENWDTFTQKRAFARQRAAEKSARYGGVKVGEKFLYRGTLDASRKPKLRKALKEMIADTLTRTN